MVCSNGLLCTNLKISCKIVNSLSIQELKNNNNNNKNKLFRIIFIIMSLYKYQSILHSTIPCEWRKRVPGGLWFLCIALLLHHDPPCWKKYNQMLITLKAMTENSIEKEQHNDWLFVIQWEGPGVCHRRKQKAKNIEIKTCHINYMKKNF